jgi:hypothetical protein
MAARTHTNKDPNGVIVKRLAPSGQSNDSTIQAYRGESQGWKVWVGQADPTSSSEANLSFQNPEDGNILARPSYVVVTAGTGTVDIGVSTGGTGSAAGIFDGGALTVGKFSRFTFNGTVAASAVLGTVDLGAVIVGGNGSATDSIVGRVTDGIASTAEIYMVVEYIDLVTGG